MEAVTTAPKFIKTKDLAKMFNVTERTVWNWCTEGLLPFYRVGRAIFFREDEVARRMDQYRHLGYLRCPAGV